MKAFAIDSFILVVLLVILHFALLGQWHASRTQNILVGLPLWPYYLALQLRPGAHRGQTIGKQIVGIRIVAPGGDRVGAARLVAREVFRTAISLPLYLTPMFAFFLGAVDPGWILYDRHHRALHDLVGRTYVVDVRT
jgi:uncharacterized RDD family membrane protein YckC